MNKIQPSIVVVKRRIAGDELAGPYSGHDFDAAKAAMLRLDHTDTGGRSGEGVECPVCKHRTIVEFWVDDKSWKQSKLPAGTCLDCFNNHGPCAAELQGLYVRGTNVTMDWEAEEPETQSRGRGPRPR